jgi:transposase InsO family protein
MITTSSSTSNQYQLFVGIDIAATTATAAWHFHDGNAHGASPIEYIEVWYNRQRRHSALGYASPEAFEKRHFESNPVSTKSVLRHFR